MLMMVISAGSGPRGMGWEKIDFESSRLREVETHRWGDESAS